MRSASVACGSNRTSRFPVRLLPRARSTPTCTRSRPGSAWRIRGGEAPGAGRTGVVVKPYALEVPDEVAPCWPVPAARPEDAADREPRVEPAERPRAAPPREPAPLPEREPVPLPEREPVPLPEREPVPLPEREPVEREPAVPLAPEPRPLAVALPAEREPAVPAPAAPELAATPSRTPRTAPRAAATATSPALSTPASP